MTEKKQKVCWHLIVVRVVALFLSAYGLYTFIVRGMPQRMFLRVAYVFFDYEESFVFFMFSNISMLCLFGNIDYWGKKLAQQRNKL